MAQKSPTQKINKKFKKKKVKLNINQIKAVAKAKIKQVKKAARKSR